VARTGSSPTAEQVFADWPGVETCSAGINNDSESPVTPELLDWADVIFVMEPTHRTKLMARFKEHLGGRRVTCLNIPDDYRFMDPALVQLLLAKVPRYLSAR
jgi:predicted protein tyrosine phosphatase